MQRVDTLPIQLHLASPKMHIHVCSIMNIVQVDIDKDQDLKFAKNSYIQTKTRGDNFFWKGQNNLQFKTGVTSSIIRRMQLIHQIKLKIQLNKQNHSHNRSQMVDLTLPQIKSFVLK